MEVDLIFCPMCGDVSEDCDHLFTSCRLVSSIWLNVLDWWQVRVAVPCGVFNVLSVAKFDFGNKMLNKMFLATRFCGSLVDMEVTK